MALKRRWFFLKYDPEQRSHQCPPRWSAFLCSRQRTVAEIGELQTLPTHLLPGFAADVRDALDHLALLHCPSGSRPAREPPHGLDRRSNDRHQKRQPLTPRVGGHEVSSPYAATKSVEPLRAVLRSLLRTACSAPSPSSPQQSLGWPPLTMSGPGGLAGSAALSGSASPICTTHFSMAAVGFCSPPSALAPTQLRSLSH